ncbi:uncharacterized protein LOC118149713 [Callithrix jacchus]|uniref:proline-rich antigen homolog n=1 Tax=Callithrix jacchus TaxID=9483 RepID=UPI00159D0452|nr:proline-rich antigen homolog [Callithrix jacchus]
MARALRGFGPPGGKRRGRPGTLSGASRQPGERLLRPSPPPRRAGPDTHPRGWHDGGSGGGGGNPARSATDCPFPPAFPRPPRCTLGDAVPPPPLSGMSAPKENYNSQCAMRGGPDTARSAGGLSTLHFP